MSQARPEKLKILVSSTVYGHEDLLDMIYATLTSLGYDVLMSHSGTIQSFSKRSAFQDCLEAVAECDLFFSFITKSYGTGRDKRDKVSITHLELRKAIELEKPRWVLAHHDVVFARTLLRDLGYATPEQRLALGKQLKKGAIIDDLRVIDMYEEATRSELELDKRTGNWVQKFRSDQEALLFAEAQFHRYQEVERFVVEQLKDPSAIAAAIGKEGES